MKKIKPWTGQKAWEEKQAKVAKEADGNNSISHGFLDALKIIREKNKEYMDSQIYGHFLPPVPKDKLSAQFPPSGIGSQVVSRGKPPDGLKSGYAIFHDQYDKYLFGGEDGDRDKDLRLPQGISPYLYGDWVNGSDKAEQKPVCCREEDKVNIGMLHDKWCCKVCGKDM